MAISDKSIQDAIVAISQIKGLEMNANELVEDVVLVAAVFEAEEEFHSAIGQIIRHLLLIVTDRADSSALERNYEGWKSFHFPSKRKNGHPADLRVVYQDGDEVKRIRGFGHRHIPASIYKRLTDR